MRRRNVTYSVDQQLPERVKAAAAAAGLTASAYVEAALADRVHRDAARIHRAWLDANSDEAAALAAAARGTAQRLAVHLGADAA